ncbi:hypothetical protein D3C72_1613150 [compost metagenome]
MSSKAVKRSPMDARMASRTLTASSSDFTPANADASAVGNGNSFSVAAVMIPSVPSDPMSICFRSYPVLSLRSARRRSRTSPSGRTTSRPSTSSRILP